MLQCAHSFNQLHLKGPQSPLSPLKACGEKQAGNAHFTDVAQTRESSNMLWVCMLSHVGIIAILPGVSVGAGRHRPGDAHNWNNAYICLWVIVLCLFTIQTFWFWNHDLKKKKKLFCLVLNLEVIVCKTQQVDGFKVHGTTQLERWLSGRSACYTSPRRACVHPPESMSKMAGSGKPSVFLPSVKWTQKNPVDQACWSIILTSQQVPGSVKTLPES